MWQAAERYPDPAIQVLDPRFLKYRLFNASVERLATGCRWSEGPVWFGDGRYLLWSDIPNDRIMRWDEASSATSVFRAGSHHANGNTRDRQGRLLDHDNNILAEVPPVALQATSPSPVHRRWLGTSTRVGTNRGSKR